MSYTFLAGKPPIKIGGRWRPAGKGPHDDVEVRVAYSVLNVPTLGWMLANVKVCEMRVSAVEDGWRIMVKGKRRGKPVVAYFFERHWRDAFVLMATSMDAGKALFWPDDYPPKNC